MSSECLVEPDGISDTLVIRSRPAVSEARLPISCTLTLVPLRGPVRLEVEYRHGELVYEAGTFEPYTT